GNDITLNNANNFGGAVSVVSGNNVTLNDTGILRLGEIHAATANLTAGGDILNALYNPATPNVIQPVMFVPGAVALTSTGGSIGIGLAPTTDAHRRQGITFDTIPASITLSVPNTGYAVLTTDTLPLPTPTLLGGAAFKGHSWGCTMNPSQCVDYSDNSVRSISAQTTASILAAALEDLLESINSTDSVGPAIKQGFITAIGVVPPGIDAIEGEGVNLPEGPAGAQSLEQMLQPPVDEELRKRKQF
ncbi:MAG: hypothetical protein MUC79_15550, partial [Thiobacillaceae bacterium]|nr:hypothetical protein [Thiobacillaceae bacterium]